MTGTDLVDVGTRAIGELIAVHRFKDGRQLPNKPSRLGATGLIDGGDWEQRDEPARVVRKRHGIPLHGPYYQWTRKMDGKIKTVLLTPVQLERYKPWFDNAQQLRALTAKLEPLSLDIANTTELAALRNSRRGLL